jgi:hypothetical protein
MGKLNDAAYGALITITGVTAYQGRVRLPDTTDFESNIRALEPEGECIAIDWVTATNKAPVEMGTAELTVLLFFNFPKDDTTDCNTMYDLVDEIVTALAKDSVWEPVSSRALGITTLRVEDGLQDDVAEWRITVNLQIPPAC